MVRKIEKGNYQHIMRREIADARKNGDTLKYIAVDDGYGVMLVCAFISSGLKISAGTESIQS